MQSQILEPIFTFSINFILINQKKKPQVETLFKKKKKKLIYI